MVSIISGSYIALMHVQVFTFLISSLLVKLFDVIKTGCGIMIVWYTTPPITTQTPDDVISTWRQAVATAGMIWLFFIFNSLCYAPICMNIA